MRRWRSAEKGPDNQKERRAASSNWLAGCGHSLVVVTDELMIGRRLIRGNQMWK
jgi:hypothetical protein